MNVLISAVICTHNRANYISKAVKSLINQTLPLPNYEIIVVDNASDDNTRQVIEEFSKVENLKYIYEPILGLSQARNTGWKNAKGEYAAFLDDDAIASKDWLENILKTFETIKPKPGCVGGKIEPIWESLKPNWLAKESEVFLSILDYSDKPLILEQNQNLFGTNMAFPRNLLKNMGGFDTNFGRKGKSLRSGEEALLQRDIKNAGYSVFYNPKIIVKHHILSSRLTKEWFKKRAYYEGMSNALMELKEKLLRPYRVWKALRKTVSLFFPPQQIIALMIPTDNPYLFSYKFIARIKIGHILGLIKLNQENNRISNKNENESK